MQQKTIAKDPIDYIRNYKFSSYAANPSSTTGSAMELRSLIIRLSDNVNPMTVEVTLRPDQYKAAGVIADWLEKQPLFFVQPYAAVTRQATVKTTLLEITVNTFDARPALIKAHLDDIVDLIDRTSADMQAGDTFCIRPSYQPDHNQQLSQTIGGGNYNAAQPGQVIGHIVLDSPRTPAGYNSGPGMTSNKSGW